MRNLNFWFDLPSALTGAFFLASGAVLAWKMAIGEEPLNGSTATTAGFFLLLGAGFLWMSIRLGAIARRKRDRERARKQHEALHTSNVGSH